MEKFNEVVDDLSINLNISLEKEFKEALKNPDFKDLVSKIKLSKEEYGTVLRAKGVVMDKSGDWIHFDYVPGEPDVREGSASVCGRICVIGANINEQKIKELFNA